MAEVVGLRKSGKKGGAGIGGAIGKVGGALVGGILGGPGGALQGASVGGQVGSAYGGLIAPSKQAEQSQTVAPQTATARRLAEIQKTDLAQLAEAKAALPELPPDIRAQIEAPLAQAMELLKGKR